MLWCSMCTLFCSVSVFVYIYMYVCMYIYVYGNVCNGCYLTCCCQEGSKKFAELSGKLGGNIKKQVKQVSWM